MLPAESVTEVMLEVVLFQPMARMLVLPAACALGVGHRDRIGWFAGSPHSPARTQAAPVATAL